MKLINFVAPRPQFSDNNGSPLAFGRVSFYEAGTTTLKEVYTTADKTTGAQNPHELDQGGFVRDGGVWLDEGRYTILVESSDGAGGWVEDYTIEDIAGSGDVSNGLLTSAIVPTIQDLRNLDAGQFEMVFIAGYYVPHDRGEGCFIWEENNSDADNGGTIINSSGAPAFGRWVRLIQQAEIIPQIFGGMEATTFGVASNFQSMIDWCNHGGNEEYRKITIPTGGYFLDGNVDFNGGIDLEMSDQTFFTSHPATSGTLTITCHKVDVNKKTLPLVLSDITLVFNPSDVNIRTNPRWYGDANFENFTQCVTTSGSRELDIYSGLNIENTATGTLFVSGMHWHGDVGGNNVFNIESTNLNITIDEIFVESERDSEIFTNEFGNVRILKGDVYAHWFNIPTSSKFDDLLDVATNAGENPSNIIWSRNKSFTIAGFSSNAFAVNHIIDGGCSINVVDALPFYTITAGRYQIFNENGGYPEIKNGQIYPEWLGMVPNEVGSPVLSKNILAFRNVIKSALNRGMPIVGLGLTYSFNDNVLSTDIGTLNLQDIKLSFLPTTGVTPNIETEALLKWKNVYIVGSNDINSVILKSNSSSGDEFTGCTFEQISNLGFVNLNIAEQVKIKDCTFIRSYLNIRGGKVYDNVFSRSNLIIHRLFNSLIPDRMETIPLDVLNNEFKIFSTTLTNQSRVEFRGSEPETIFGWITVKGNFWTGDPLELGQESYMMFTTNAKEEFNRVDIYNNTNATNNLSFSVFPSYVRIPSTRFLLRKTLTGANGSTVFTLDTNMIILKGRVDIPVWVNSHIAVDSSGEGIASMNYQGNYPVVEFFYSQSSGESFSELYAEIYTSVRESNLTYGGHL